MKRILIAIIVALSSVATYAQTIIDFDYTKHFKGDGLSIDFNENGELDEDEILIGQVDAFVEYKDFDTAGNIMRIECIITNSEGKSVRMRTQYKNVSFINDENIWFVVNKLDEPLFGVNENLIAIFDIISYELVEDE